ncbi:MAG: TetR/AcrR family transcriptional regulator, partial [Burkholderiales bacterium]|nr:TetR/AcrR family transcriptional regulator [Burkholderiales bacterium]
RSSDLEVMQMSKSGVFAHFGSREELQISVVREYHQHFEEEVFFPAVAGPRGLPRLRAMFANWMKRTSIEIEAGCIYISGAVEFDDRPGPVRDALASSVKTWLSAMNRAVVLAKKEGHLRAEVDEQQMTFEIHGLILALHYEARFLKTPGSVDRALAGFERIVREHQTPDAPPAPVATPVAQAAKRSPLTC